MSRRYTLRRSQMLVGELVMYSGTDNSLKDGDQL